MGERHLTAAEELKVITVLKSKQLASSYLLDLSREALTANRYTDKQLASNDSCQNNEYADL